MVDAKPAGSFLGQTLTILRKDLSVEWRTKERLTPMVLFVLLVLLVFNFSFEGLGGAALSETGPGVLWSAFVFAGLLSLHRTFASERHNDTLDALLLAPVSRSVLYLAKMLGNLVFLVVLELLSLPLFGLFFNLSPAWPLLGLPLVLVLGAACLASVGTLFAAMSIHSRLREQFLPLLVLPMMVPALISCIGATAEVFEQCQRLAFGEVGEILSDRMLVHLRMLAIYAVVFNTLALMLFEYVVEE